MPRASSVAPALLLTVIAGVAAMSPRPALAADLTATFLCSRGVVVSVTFGEGSARLTYKNRSVTLAQQPVASGYLYSDGVHSLRGKGREAVWTDAAGTARDCREQEAAMQQPQVDPPRLSLGGTVWRLVHFQSSDDAIGTIVPPRLERYTMEFRADGGLAIRLDCNALSASRKGETASARGGSLAFSPGALTRAACGPGALDTQIARDLGRIRSFTVIDGQLALALKADGGVYLWDPVPSQ